MSCADESMRRAIRHPSHLCGDNETLDRTFRVFCDIACQIAYILHDEERTVISSCYSGFETRLDANHQYIRLTCSTSLCNNYAIGQTNETDTDSGGGGGDARRLPASLLIVPMVSAALAFPFRTL